MPKYVVLTPIEKDNVMYVPKGATQEKTMPSVSHGKVIPVNTSGFIELTEEAASHLVHGQVPVHDGKPDPVNGAEFRLKKATDEAAAAGVAAAARNAEFDEFEAYRAAKAKAPDATEATDKKKAPRAKAGDKPDVYDAKGDEADDRAEEDADAAKAEDKKKAKK